MTNVIYNGVVLQDVETHTFDQRVVRDESDTDVMYSLFKIRVSSTVVGFVGVFGQQHPSSIVVSQGNIAQQIQQIHARLSEDRKNFYYFIPGVPADPNAPSYSTVMLMATGWDADENATIPADPVGGGTVPKSEVVDVNNGPKTSEVEVDQIFGGRAIRASVTFEIARKMCPEGFQDVRPDGAPSEVPEASEDVLSNRWYVIEAKDANWITTRILQGTLRVASRDVKPHLMRHLVVPDLLRGYQRTSMEFATDPTDLVLKYRVEDRQRHEAPPKPAIDWSGHYVESAGKHGIVQHSEISVRLIGPPGVNKLELIGAAGVIVKQRMVGIQKDPGDAKPEPAAGIFNGILESSSIVDVIGEPVVEMNVRFRRFEPDNPGDPKNVLNTRIEHIGKPLQIPENVPANPNSIDQYQPDVWPVPHLYDREDSIAGVFASYLQHPCSVYHAVPTFSPGEEDAPSYDRPENEFSPTTDYGEQPSDVRVYPAQEPFDTFDPETTRIRNSQQFEGHPYNLIDIEIEYDGRVGRIQLPYARDDIPPADDTCAIIQLHSGIHQRIVRIEASRVGIPPIIPKPEDELTDPNGIVEKLISSRVGIKNPEMERDGISRTFTVMAEHRYALSRALRTNEKLRIPLSPTDRSADFEGAAAKEIDTAYLWDENNLIGG